MNPILPQVCGLLILIMVFVYIGYIEIKGRK